jgi:hypothetical protein
MGWEELEQWQDQDSEIREITGKLHHLVDNCLGNMGIEEMEEIQRRMGDLIAQGLFWLKNDNAQRFVYDMRVFGLWLCDYIGDNERKFCGDIEPPEDS